MRFPLLRDFRHELFSRDETFLNHYTPYSVPGLNGQCVWYFWQAG